MHEYTYICLCAFGSVKRYVHCLVITKVATWRGIGLHAADTTFDRMHDTSEGLTSSLLISTSLLCDEYTKEAWGSLL
jgi:hypothetical protein